MKDIKIVAFDFYFDCPKWLNENRTIKLISLTRSCTSDEVDALLYGLLGHNDIPFSDNPTQDLYILMEQMNENEIAFSGGLMFQEDDLVILPGCCCGLENWKEIISDISEKQIPWMGHDPFVTCLYEDQDVIVCSDDISYYHLTKSENQGQTPIIQQIRYKKEELDHLFAQLQTDMKEFTQYPLKKRIARLAPGMEDDFCEAWIRYFG